jgi:signal transduction histidine kinase
LQHETPGPLRLSGVPAPVLTAIGDPDFLVELLRSSPAGVVLVEASPELPIVYFNDSFERSAPLVRRPTAGRGLADLFAWVDRAEIRRAYRRAITTGLPVHGVPGVEGSHWNVSHYPLRGPEGEGRVTHVLSVSIDVLEHSWARAAEAQAREAAALRRQMEQSIQLEQLKTNFLKLASHELRAPLGVVRGYVSMLEDGTLGEVGADVAPILPVLRAKLEEMNQLIDEILETARLEDSALELRRARLDLREVVSDAVHALAPLAAARHHLTTSSAEQPVLVEGDRSRLTMIVTNLLHNAIKYSPRGGEVRVSCAVQDGTACVAVSDEGMGIAEADQARLFTRFGRIATEETRTIPGTGLGLYLARDLARRHDGGIGVRSQAGRGSTFTLTLPLVA